MNFLQHRQKTRCHVLRLPDGLQELMADISREVLRCQPSMDCIYKFIADYLEAMVKTRDKCNIAMAVIEEAILKTDEIYDQFLKCHFPVDKTDSFLDVMEMTFRRFIELKRRRNEDPRYITFHADDLLDELIRKCDVTKVEILRSRPAIQWAYKKFVKAYIAAIEGTLDTEDLYMDTKNLIASSKEMREMHESAIIIQKTYRGHYVRETLKRNMSRSTPQPSKVSVMNSFLKYAAEHEEELKKSAIVIQTSYRGHSVRKKLRASPESVAGVRSTAESMVGKISRETVEKITKFKSDAGDEELIDLENCEDLEEYAKAAVKIQASYKGFKVRKEMSHERKKD